MRYLLIIIFFITACSASEREVLGNYFSCDITITEFQKNTDFKIFSNNLNKNGNRELHSYYENQDNYLIVFFWPSGKIAAANFMQRGKVLFWKFDTPNVVLQHCEQSPPNKSLNQDATDVAPIS